MELIDTHCHLHDTELFADSRESIYHESLEAGVVMICVGTSVASSRESIAFCHNREGCYPIVGIHPHDAKDSDPAEIGQLVEAHRDEVIGIGEIGLDYYYEHSPRAIQQAVLRAQLTLAAAYDLPVSFHVRDGIRKDGTPRGEVFDDFWLILDDYPGIRGVLHSFTDSREHAEEALRRGLLIGINGICTFTRDLQQQTTYREIPLSKILLETDAPFLTPKPFRGKMNLPAYVGRVAEFQAVERNLPVETVARITTANAKELFGI